MDSMPLWQKDAPGSDAKDGFVPTLERYAIAGDRPRGAVLVCPGGGYGGRAGHEAAPIAQRFNKEGFQAFVVHYRVAPHKHPAPLFDVARAIRLIRANAAAWHVAPNHIAVCGFSAGGHLAASLGVHFADATPPKPDDIDRLPCRPDTLILCYPVISSGEFAHDGSFWNLLGENPPAELRDYMSLDRHVTPDTPPAFLWHTYADDGVPVENTLLFAQALRRSRVPFELHVYPNGCHGLGLAHDFPHVSSWAHLCGDWLRESGF